MEREWLECNHIYTMNKLLKMNCGTLQLQVGKDNILIWFLNLDLFPIIINFDILFVDLRNEFWKINNKNKN